MKKKVLITREYEEAKELGDRLESFNLEPVIFPTIKTIPLEFSVNIDDYDILIFSSKKGVKYFFKRLTKEDFKKLNSKLFIAVGEKTGDILKKLGFKNVIIPEVFSSEGILKLIKDNWDFYKNKKILFPKAKKGIDLLEKSLPNVKPIYLYETKFNKPENIKEVEDLLKNKYIDIVIFTSPSTFLGFKELFSNNYINYLKSTKVIVMGKTTGKTLKENGVLNFYIPEKSTIEGILDLVKKIV